MKDIRNTILYLLSVCMITTSISAAELVPVPGLELVNKAKQYHGHVVQFQGEVIGDIMVRGEHAWINVNDGTIAIGIWTSKITTKQITHAGSYRAKGDMIIINGVFNRSCIEHGGDLDIHAQDIRIIPSGHAITDPLTKHKLISAGILSVMVLIILAFEIEKRRKKNDIPGPRP